MAYPSVSAIQYDSGEAMRRAAAAIRNRLWKPRIVQSVPTLPEPEPVVETVQNEPQVIDAVSQYRQIVVYPALKGTAKEYVMRRSDELGVSFADIIGPRRRHDLIEARHQLIGEVYLRFPNLSLPQLGTLFGNRDHTSIYSALRKIGVYGTRAIPERAS